MKRLETILKEEEEEELPEEIEYVNGVMKLFTQPPKHRKTLDKVRVWLKEIDDGDLFRPGEDISVFNSTGMRSLLEHAGDSLESWRIAGLLCGDAALDAVRLVRAIASGVPSVTEDDKVCPVSFDDEDPVDAVDVGKLRRDRAYLRQVIFEQRRDVELASRAIETLQTQLRTRELGVRQLRGTLLREVVTLKQQIIAKKRGAVGLTEDDMQAIATAQFSFIRCIGMLIGDTDDADDEMKKALSSLRDQIEQEQSAQVGVLNDQIKQHEQEAAALAAQLETLKQSSSDAKASSEARIAEMNYIHEGKLKTMRDEHQQEMSEFKNQLEQERSAALTAAEQKYDKTCSDYEAELAELRAGLADAEIRHVEAEEELVRARESMQKELNRTQTMLAEATAQISGSQSISFPAGGPIHESFYMSARSPSSPTDEFAQQPQRRGSGHSHHSNTRPRSRTQASHSPRSVLSPPTSPTLAPQQHGPRSPGKPGRARSPTARPQSPIQTGTPAAPLDAQAESDVVALSVNADDQLVQMLSRWRSGRSQSSAEGEGNGIMRIFKSLVAAVDALAATGDRLCMGMAFRRLLNWSRQKRERRQLASGAPVNRRGAVLRLRRALERLAESCIMGVSQTTREELWQILGKACERMLKCIRPEALASAVILQPPRSPSPRHCQRTPIAGPASELTLVHWTPEPEQRPQAVPKRPRSAPAGGRKGTGWRGPDPRDIKAVISDMATTYGSEAREGRDGVFSEGLSSDGGEPDEIIDVGPIGSPRSSRRAPFTPLAAHRPPLTPLASHRAGGVDMPKTLDLGNIEVTAEGEASTVLSLGLHRARIGASFPVKKQRRPAGTSEASEHPDTMRVRLRRTRQIAVADRERLNEPPEDVSEFCLRGLYAGDQDSRAERSPRREGGRAELRAAMPAPMARRDAAPEEPCKIAVCGVAPTVSGLTQPLFNTLPEAVAAPEVPTERPASAPPGVLLKRFCS
eukprot:Hpha_TRINITY_DN33927_c0_g1::TRINITY_DN33927_c0_g1_i1::g.69484::m.69484